MSRVGYHLNYNVDQQQSIPQRINMFTAAIDLATVDRVMCCVINATPLAKEIDVLVNFPKEMKRVRSLAFKMSPGPLGAFHVVFFPKKYSSGALPWRWDLYTGILVIIEFDGKTAKLRKKRVFRDVIYNMSWTCRRGALLTHQFSSVSQFESTGLLFVSSGGEILWQRGGLFLVIAPHERHDLDLGNRPSLSYSLFDVGLFHFSPAEHIIQVTRHFAWKSTRKSMFFLFGLKVYRKTTFSPLFCSWWW